MRIGRWMAIVGGGGVLMASLAVATLCLSSGCASVGYLAQGAQGHLALAGAARPVPAWLDDPATPPALAERLRLSQRLRDFAVTDLQLPDNRSYRSYADLGRPAPIWNVVAAPELSLDLVPACFPVVGCVGYRGYFDEAAARAEAARLQALGLEVNVYPVPAYSTLGWTNWLGGDPLLNSFIRWPEGELARLIFHELSHQVLYIAGDTAFNESFATAVEQLGGDRWLAAPGQAAARAADRQQRQRREEFRALLGDARAALDQVYRGSGPADERRAAKQQVYAALQARYRDLKASPAWAGFNGYDAALARVNNAVLGVSGAYHQWVPAFLALFEAQGQRFDAFYTEVARIGALPTEARRAELQRWMPQPGSPTPTP